MSFRKFLYEIEEKYGKHLDAWDRSKAKEAAALFVTPFLSPPEEYVIQGLMPAPKPAEKNFARAPPRRALPPADGLCAKCDFRDKISGKCIVKRVKGDETACYYVQQKAVAPQSNNPRDREAASAICRACDYRDKIHSVCVLKREGFPCAYENGRVTIKVRSERL